MAYRNLRYYLHTDNHNPVDYRDEKFQNENIAKMKPTVRIPWGGYAQYSACFVGNSGGKLHTIDLISKKSTVTSKCIYTIIHSHSLDHINITAISQPADQTAIVSHSRRDQRCSSNGRKILYCKLEIYG